MLLVTDQFENKRHIKVRFTAPRQPPPTPEREREQLSEITDPIEKAVASVLQAEIARYRTNGRREGGFEASLPPMVGESSEAPAAIRGKSGQRATRSSSPIRRRHVSSQTTRTP
jgi:hypothetical protein